MRLEMHRRWRVAVPCVERYFDRGLKEATAGFEPAYKGFAGPCLTAWLRRRA